MLTPKDKTNILPTTPGIYQFYDRTGKILYIGKAKNLRSRVKSYFLRAEELTESRSTAIYQMVQKIKRIKTTSTDSELEAVLLEAELIKKVQPKYNIRQKDDKSFSVIEISRDEIPRLEIKRARNVDKSAEFAGQARTGAEYFGPYPSAEILKRALRILRKIFPYANCSKTKFQRQQKICKTCLYADINLCPAPCEKSSVPDCKKQVGYLKDFLSGKKKKIIRELSAEMKVLSRNRKYEEAAVIRDKLSAIEHLNRYSVGIKDSFLDFQNLAIFPRIEAYDISNIGGEFAVGAMTVTTLGRIDKSEYRKFKIRSVMGANDLAMTAQILERRFKNSWPEPNLIVIDGGIGQLNIARHVIKDIKLDIPIVAIAKGKSRKKDEFRFSTGEVAKIFQKKPELRNLLIQARNEAHRFSRSYYRGLHRKATINEPKTTA